MWTRSHHLLRTGRVGKTTACQPSAIRQTAAAPRQSGARMLFLHKPHSTYSQATARYCKLCHHTSWPPSLSMLGHARHRVSSCSSLVLKTSCANSNRRVIATSAGIHCMCLSSTLGKSRASSATSRGLSSSSSWRTTTCSLSTLQSVSNSRSANNNSSPSLPAVDHISSAANPYIKHCVKLRQSTKYRQQQRRVLLVGETLLAELAESSKQLEVLVLFTRPEVVPPASVTAQRVIHVNDTVMKKLTGLEEAAGVSAVAELALPEYLDLSMSSSVHLQQPRVVASKAAGQAGQARQQPMQQLQRLLVLEGVQDPGNLGTLLRCAAAFGWDAVWLLPGCCDPFNDKALRASRGAALQVPLAAGPLQELLQAVKQHDMLLLAAEPEPEGQHQQQGSSSTNPAGSPAASCACRESTAGLLLSANLHKRPVCLVLGTEGAGLSEAVLQHAAPIAVPMTGHMESLNVGVAGAILMFALSDGCLQLMVKLQQLKQL